MNQIINRNKITPIAKVIKSIFPYLFIRFMSVNMSLYIFLYFGTVDFVSDSIFLKNYLSDLLSFLTFNINYFFSYANKVSRTPKNVVFVSFLI